MVMIKVDTYGPEGRGYFEVDNRPAGFGHFEADTYTCGHCEFVVVMNPERKRERYMCKGCGRHMCDNCAANYVASNQTCESFRRKAEEAVEAARRSGGGIILP